MSLSDEEFVRLQLELPFAGCIVHAVGHQPHQRVVVDRGTVQQALDPLGNPGRVLVDATVLLYKIAGRHVAASPAGCLSRQCLAISSRVAIHASSCDCT